MLKKQVLLQAILISFMVSLAHGTASKEPGNTGTKKHSDKEFIIVVEGGNKDNSSEREKLLVQASTEIGPLLQSSKTIDCCKTTGLVIGGATVYLIATAIVGGLLFGLFKFVESREP